MEQRTSSGNNEAILEMVDDDPNLNDFLDRVGEEGSQQVERFVRFCQKESINNLISFP